MDGDPMIDDEVGAHTKVTVLAYWKFESVSLQRGVCEPSVPRQKDYANTKAPPERPSHAK
jgi:hypothetical protein